MRTSHVFGEAQASIIAFTRGLALIAGVSPGLPWSGATGKPVEFARAPLGHVRQFRDLPILSQARKERGDVRPRLLRCLLPGSASRGSPHGESPYSQVKDPGRNDETLFKRSRCEMGPSSSYA